jgi:very-short-patch-repair endonuclease
MARSPGRRLSVLERAIELHLSGSAGTRSAKEDAYLASLPADQQRLVRVNTKLEVDFHWPEAGLVVEVDGHGHTRMPTRHEDAARDARLELADQTVHRIEAR